MGQACPTGSTAVTPATMVGMPAANVYRKLSFWHDTVPGTLEPGDPLPGDLEADVAIAGAGYTGLWTAYYLSRADPGLKIAVCERDIAGFGASGRNGGWCSALFPASLGKLERMAGRDAAIAMYRAMQATVDEVGKVTAAEGIDCHWAKGGTVQLARSAVQLERAREEVEEARAFGFGDDDLRLLSADEARGLAGASGVAGGTFTPHCAAIHPSRLARGLAEVVRKRGVSLYERTPVLEMGPGRLVTARGTVRARHVIRATEGYTALLPGQRRAVAPVYSLMIATAPLPEAVWDEIGLATRPTFNDLRHLIIYGQRTADGRLAFGGRGAAADPGRPVPGAGRGRGDARLGRPDRGAAGLVRVRWPGPVHRARLGGRVRRRRGGHHQPGRADPGRPDQRGRHRDHPAPVGGPSLAALGARAAALARGERRPAHDELGRPRGGQDRAPVPGGARHGQVPRLLIQSRTAARPADGVLATCQAVLPVQSSQRQQARPHRLTQCSGQVHMQFAPPVRGCYDHWGLRRR